MRASRVVRLIWQTFKRFESMERRRDAGALTYTTLFALVPLITVFYSMLSAIPALREMGASAHNDLLSYVMPEGSEMVSEYLIHFSEQARELTWLGVLMLFVTSLFLLQAIEQQFNRIWQVEVERSRMQRFFRYWAVLTVGPLLFAVAQAASSVLASFDVLQVMDQVPFAARLIPWAMTTAAISFIYMMVPNTNVPWRHALISALVVATVFESGKLLFAQVVGMFPTYQLIYGAFTAVPLFLMWLYGSWLLVLFGAELTYSLSHPDRGGRLDPVRQRLALVQALYQSQQDGGGVSEKALRRQLRGIPPQQLVKLLSLFRRRNWIIQTQEGGWVWVRDLRHMTMNEFVGDIALQDLSGNKDSASSVDEDGQDSLAGSQEISAGAEDAFSNWQRRWREDASASLNDCLDDLITRTES